MVQYVALLRGINVGGNKKIKMADLRALFASLGFANTKTLLQSGNVVFKSDLAEPDEVVTRIEERIASQYGFDVTLVLRTAEAFKAAAEDNPLTEAQCEDGGKAAIMFLRDAVDADALESIREAHAGQEVFYGSNREIYLYYPDGMGRSKLTHAVFEKHLNTLGTVRNLNTVNKMLALIEPQA